MHGWRPIGATSIPDAEFTPADVKLDIPIERLGDTALLVRFGAAIDAALNQRVHACAQILRARAPAWLLDLAPAYASLAAHVDTSGLRGDDPLSAAEAWLRETIDENLIEDAPTTPREMEIPVIYGGDAGPDLAEVAARAGIGTEALVAMHMANQYTVAMMGFAPGFPYLLGLDARLATPRHARPRERVAAGSVGIGGAQTGIYPAAGPGGWRIIGRTPLRLFDPTRHPPCLLQAGDRVRFVAIDAARFAELEAQTRRAPT
ncbi:MAG: 5-oxoprolinase subunit PxpB [Proteobacteria bacterium]|nr:5-oxoprolinase subunit PxpB [Pseudomonadota bacterium]